jgi:hypothetical protein
MHLYDAGVPLPYIRDILGHVDLSTTDIYARASTEAKRKALEAVYDQVVSAELTEWNQDPELLNWLANLKRPTDPDGVSTFRTHKTRPGRAPSIARGRWCSSRPATITSLHPAHHSAVSLHRATTSITARLRLTSHQRGFKQFAHPIFPSPGTPGWIRSAFGFPPSFAPRNYSQRTSGRGRTS